MRFLRVLLLVIVILPLFYHTPNIKITYACDCAFETDHKKALEESDVVFDGIVDSRKLPGRSVFGTSSSDNKVKFTFSVNGSWKGEIEKKVSVYTAQASASCGYEFEVGRRYVVFGSYKGDNINVSFCSATKELSDSSPVLEELGPYEVISNTYLYEPSDSTEHAKSYETYTTVLIIVFCSLFILLVVGMLIYRTKKKQ